MKLELNDQQKMIEKMVREFAKKEIEPIADKLDKNEEYPKETLKKMAQLGLLGITIPTEYGGAGLDTISYAIIVEEMKKIDLYYKTWQAFAVLLPVKTVGVMGDERTYENVLALRAVESSDGMTADWVKLPYELLEKISNRIINEVRGINRVVYDLTSKPPGTIEWE